MRPKETPETTVKFTAEGCSDLPVCQQTFGKTTTCTSVWEFENPAERAALLMLPEISVTLMGLQPPINVEVACLSTYLPNRRPVQDILQMVNALKLRRMTQTIEILKRTHPDMNLGDPTIADGVRAVLSAFFDLCFLTEEQIKEGLDSLVASR